MSENSYKVLIDKILSGLKINSANTDETVNKPDNEMSVVKEELTDAISGDKTYGDIPGLQVEENEPLYQEEGIFPEIHENNTADPLEGIEVIFFYIMNRDLVSKIISFPQNTTNGNGKFKTIQDAAIYLLQQQNIKYTEEDVNELVKELIILNSHGYETTLNKKISNALENINRGSIKHTDYNENQTGDIPKESSTQNFYKNIGLSENMCNLAETVSLDTIISANTTQNNVYNDLLSLNEFKAEENNLSGNTSLLYNFGTLSEIFDILASLPLITNRPLQAGIKAINNSLKTGAEISGAELLKIFYGTQDSIIKSGVGQFKNLPETNINTNDDILSFLSSTAKDSNTGMCLNDNIPMNLRLLLSYENAKTMLEKQITDRFGITDSFNETENILDNFHTLTKIYFKTVTGDDGNLEYIIRYSGNNLKVKSCGEVIALCLSLMSSEINSNQTLIPSEITSDHTNDKTNTTEQTAELTLDGNALMIDTDEIKAQLFQGGVKFNGECIGKLSDDGKFICKINNKYILELPENSSGEKCQLIYTSDGDLKQEKTEYTTKDGMYTSILREYSDKKPKREFSTTVAENKVVSASEKTTGGLYKTSEYFYKDGELSKLTENTNRKEALAKYPNALSVKKISSFNDLIDIYEYSYPEGFEYDKTLVIVNKKLKEEISLNINRNGITTNNKGYLVNIDDILKNIKTINEQSDSHETMKPQNISEEYYYNKENPKLTKTEINGDENFGEIKLYDENNQILGELLYKQSNDGNSLNIYSFNTCDENIDINLKLIEELLTLAEKYNKDVITTYLGKLNVKNGQETFDLKSYYKIGFQAEDSGTDKLIRKCLTKEIPVPIMLSQFVALKYNGDITPSKQIPAISLQKAHKELETLLNDDSTNIEYKNLFENLEKLDYENISLHINNIKKCINDEMDGDNLKIALDKGYFSSSKGAEAFETFYNMFTNHGTGPSSVVLNTILTNFDVKNFDNAKRRGLLDKLNMNNVKQINLLASYTDKQYNQKIKFADMGIEYISENDDINYLAVKYVKDKTGSSYSQDEIEKILLQVNDPQKIAEISDELIKTDSSVVRNLLKYTNNPKFVAENLIGLIALNTKLYTASNSIQISCGFKSGFYDYRDVCSKLYPNEDILSIMFDIGTSDRYTDEQLYEIGIRINDNNKDFVKKLALSCTATPYEVLKILNDTRLLTIFNEHPSELTDSQLLESYNILLSMPENLKIICKNCGLNIDFEIQNLFEKYIKINKTTK